MQGRRYTPGPFSSQIGTVISLPDLFLSCRGICVTCCALVRVEAERQPIIRTCWRCFVWCTAGKELQSLLWTIPRKSTVGDHKSTLPPDSPGNRLRDLRQQLCCRLTKEQKWQLLFDGNWRNLAPSSQTKWLVYLRKWKVMVCYLGASL